MKSHYVRCLSMFSNPWNILSPKTLNPKILFISFTSFSPLKLFQNMKNEVLNSVQDSIKSCLGFHTLCHDLQFVSSYKVRTDHYPLNLFTIFSLRATIFVETKPPKHQPNHVMISPNRTTIFNEASTSILSQFQQ